MPHIILDTETTGTDPRRDKIVEIGAVDLDTRATFHAYYNPGIPVPAEATAVHGLTDEFLAAHPPFDPAPFLAFIGDATLVAHNAPFDLAFINAALPKPLPNPVVDTLAIAKRKHPLANNTLDGLCRRYGIDTSKRTKHGALVDAELLAAVYAKLTEHQATLEFVSAEKPIENIDVIVRPQALPSRISMPEREAHAAMVARIPGALWNILSTTAD